MATLVGLLGLMGILIGMSHNITEAIKELTAAIRENTTAVQKLYASEKDSDTAAEPPN